MNTIEDLSAKFGIAGELDFRSLAGDFVVAAVTNRHATATIALQGAQVIGYQPHGEDPLVWLSEDASLAPGKSIRGGVPVCWPWFGPHVSETSFPAHGFARTTPWNIVKARSLSSGATELLFELEPGPEHRHLWPWTSRARLSVTVGEALGLELVTSNEGDAPFTLSQALHTYFLVGDIDAISIHGLEGCDYLDKVGEGGRGHQDGPIDFPGEVNRIYLDTPPHSEIRDPSMKRRILIASEGSRSTVVWNPWRAFAEKLGDMGPDGYRRVVCVETANAADDSVDLASGEEYRLSAEYRISSA